MLRSVGAMPSDRSLNVLELRAFLAAEPHVEAAVLVTMLSDNPAEMRAQLTPNEVKRVDRLKCPLDQLTLLKSLAARRLWLAEYLGLPPDAIGLKYSGAGAPLLCGRAPGEASFSRSNGWCAIALAKGKRVGVDVETDRALNWSSMLDYISMPEEADWVRQAVRKEGSLAAFFRVWCSKEAVLKVMGRGFRAGPKTLLLPRNLIESGQSAEVALPIGAAQVSVTRIEEMTVALAIAAD
ncbi:MAG: 4'-phosphopantetheinyl transferase superfamily protein [Pseudomonadota bacterium]